MIATMRRLATSLLRWLAETLVRLYYPRRSVEGRQHLPSAGPSAADVVALARRDGVFMRDVTNMGRGFGGRAVRVAVKDGRQTARACDVADDDQRRVARPVHRRMERLQLRDRERRERRGRADRARPVPMLVAVDDASERRRRHGGEVERGGGLLKDVRGGGGHGGG